MILFYYKSSLTIQSLVMHPSHKLDYFKEAGWDNKWIEGVREIVEEEWERSYKRSEGDDDEVVEVGAASGGASSAAGGQKKVSPRVDYLTWMH